MSSNGSKVCCPACGTRHVVSVGDMKTRRQVDFTCSSCGTAISIAAEVVEVLSAHKPVTQQVKVQIRD